MSVKVSRQSPRVASITKIPRTGRPPIRPRGGGRGPIRPYLQSRRIPTMSCQFGSLAALKNTLLLRSYVALPPSERGFSSAPAAFHAVLPKKTATVTRLSRNRQPAAAHATGFVTGIAAARPLQLADSTKTDGQRTTEASLSPARLSQGQCRLSSLFAYPGRTALRWTCAGSAETTLSSLPDSSPLRSHSAAISSTLAVLVIKTGVRCADT